MGGLTGASCPSSPGHDDTGFLRQNDAGVNMVLTHDEMRAGNGSMVAHGGGSTPPSTDDGERWLQCSFGFKKQLNAFLVASSCFSR
jgi:hypothetical protein